MKQNDDFCVIHATKKQITNSRQMFISAICNLCTDELPDDSELFASPLSLISTGSSRLVQGSEHVGVTGNCYIITPWIAITFLGLTTIMLSYKNNRFKWIMCYLKGSIMAKCLSIVMQVRLCVDV